MCQCCNEECSAAMTDGGSGLAGVFAWTVPFADYDNEDDAPEDPGCPQHACRVALFELEFLPGQPSYFLDGALSPQPWLLFLTSGSDGAGTFARHPSKTDTVEIDTEIVEFPGPTTTRKCWWVPMEVRINSFVWTRKSPTPTYVDGTDWGDFSQWELTTPSTPPKGGEPTEGQTRCIGMSFTPMAVGFVWEPPVTAIEVSFTAGTTDSCCPSLETNFCLQYLAGSALGPYDGFYVNGTWYREKEVLCDESVSEAAVTLQFRGGSDTVDTLCHLGTLFYVGLSGLHWEEWRLACGAMREDVLTLPAAEDWEAYDAGAADDYCDTDIDTFAADDCEDGNANEDLDPCAQVTNPGPPVDCPFFHTAYRWDDVEEEWVELYDRCVSPLVKGDPPSDPPEPGESCYAYVCCDGPESCPVDWCGHYWNGTTWVLMRQCPNGLCPNPVGPPGEGEPPFKVACCTGIIPP
jgi:hypothetical protein